MSVIIPVRPSELRTPCIINYATTAPQWVLDLRGGRYFTWLQAYHARRRTGVQVFVEPGVTFRRDLTSVTFIIMPALPDAEEVITNAALRGCPTIVDVTADVLGLLDPDVPDPDMGIAALEARATLGMRDWRHEEATTLARCMRLAAVITTSWPQLVTPIREMLGHDNVFHLADTHGSSPRELHRFDAQLAAPFGVLHEWLEVR